MESAVLSARQLLVTMTAAGINVFADLQEH